MKQQVFCLDKHELKSLDALRDGDVVWFTVESSSNVMVDHDKAVHAELIDAPDGWTQNIPDA